ncbi:MAG: CDP-alcohol phosphatidyltransferase family protein [Bacteroidia bacterium]|nr:CDP-alcohol phosphatidyltransferase family protein [Bacteroidia bacterium]
MRVSFLLPNFLTLSNLALGIVAITLSYQAEWLYFAAALGGAIVCDWLDGWMARLLKAESALGKELDALADLVSFGIAPTFALYNYLKLFLPLLPYSTEVRFWMVATPFGLPLLAAWRLARFNVSPSPNPRFFEGLPTPAQGAIWALWLLTAPEGMGLHPAFWIGQILLVGGLMVSRLPFLSLKSSRNLPWMGLVVLGGVGLGLCIPSALWVSAGVLVYLGVSYAALRFVS